MDLQFHVRYETYNILSRDLQEGIHEDVRSSFNVNDRILEVIICFGFILMFCCLVGCSLYCQVGPPTVVSSSTTSDGGNINDNDNGQQPGARRQEIKMTPEERREYISRALVVKKVIRKSYDEYISELKGGNNAESNGRSIMSLHGQFRRYLYLFGGSETSRTSSSSLDEGFNSDNNDNEVQLNDISAIADDVEIPRTSPSSNIVSNTTKGDLILVDHDSNMDACDREQDNDEDDVGSESDGGSGRSSSSSTPSSQEIRKRNQQRCGRDCSKVGCGFARNDNEKDDSKNAASQICKTATENQTTTRCPICLCEYQDGEEICWSSNTKCYHAFHKSCIQQWLLQHDECPYCRKAYLVDDDDDDEEEEERIQTGRDRDDDIDGHAPPTSFLSF